MSANLLGILQLLLMEHEGMYYVQKGLYTAHFEFIKNLKKSTAIQLDSLVATQAVQER